MLADMADNVITIYNFADKMPPIDPRSTDKPLYALVDMGSNGIRFSISDLSPPRTRLLHCVYRERAGISLYDALHAPGGEPFKFSRDIISEVADTLLRFRNICDSYGVRRENILVFATEAMRTAKNRDDMLAAIWEKSGLKVDLLSPAMESLFGAMGARSGFAHVDGLFMDLGGGSVQMTYIDSAGGMHEYATLAADAAKSMPYGAAKLTDALRTTETAEKAKTDLHKQMRETFEGLQARFPRIKEQCKSDHGITIYFCGGGFRGYGSMLMHTDPIQPYPIPSIGGYTVPGSRFAQWKKMLAANNHDGKIFGMSKRRREQFPAIVTVVRALVEAVPYIKQVIFCSGGNREGVLYMKLSPDIRESSPLQVVPGGIKTDIPVNIVETIKTMVPSGSPRKDAISDNLLHYVAKNMYANMGDTDEVNSAKYLHSPTSGPLAGLPGFTHETRALFALMMCARWGSDLGRTDREMFGNLQTLVGPELSFLCDFIGTSARLLATLVPSALVDRPRTLSQQGLLPIPVRFRSQFGHNLGKKGKKDGILLEVEVEESLATGVGEALDAKFFKNVGNKLSLDWKLEAEVRIVESS